MATKMAILVATGGPLKTGFFSEVTVYKGNLKE
jgi:hypothetical protein